MLSSDKLLIVMVGLPARGKSFTSLKLKQLLSWRGYTAEIFNIGAHRRQLGIVNEKANSSYFDPKNQEAVKQREIIAMTVLDDAINFLLKKNGQIAIFDGTNTTEKRRSHIKEQVAKFGSLIKVFFLEIICNDPYMIKRNITNVKCKSPDYSSFTDPQKIIQDFTDRIAKYESTYQSLSPQINKKDAFLQTIDQGSQIFIHNSRGMIQASILDLMMNLSTVNRPIYLTRHGQSIYNKTERIGGDSDLSELGEIYSKMLVDYFQSQKKTQENIESLRVFTSTLKRTNRTAQPLIKEFNLNHKKYPNLNEINAGCCEGMTYEEIKQNLPDQFKKRSDDKLNYQYPDGESYQDLISRLEAIIYEIERSNEPVLVVSHHAIQRCLYSYFFSKAKENIPFINMPLHTIIKITPEINGYKEEIIFFDVFKKERHVMKKNINNKL